MVSIVLGQPTKNKLIMIKTLSRGRHFSLLSRLLAVCLMVLIVSPSMFAQNKVQVSGTVTDANNNPLIGIGVQEQGTTNGTITDDAGKYSLTVNPGATLVFSSIGFTTQTVPVGNRGIVNVSMAEDVEMLEGTVVVGYGTQKKVNLTGAVEQVGEEVFENRSVSNLAQALEGAVPNLNITLSDGKPNRSASFNVRGTTSIGQGGSALVLIDGVEGDPSLLNPNDIESVSVLKDAASASIYGARGTFGVVLITTKAAEKGRTRVNYTTNLSLRAPTVTPDNVTDGVTWAEMFREVYYNRLFTLPAKINAQQAYSDAWLDEFRARKAAGNTQNYEVVDGRYVYYGNEDYYDLLYKDQSFAQDHNVTIQGGTDKADFYLSGRYYKFDGLYNYNPDTYKSYNIRAKGSLQATKWLKVSNNFEYNQAFYHQPYVNSGSIMINRYIEVCGWPTMPAFNPDGTSTYCAAYDVGAFEQGLNYKDNNDRLLKNTVAARASFFGDKLHINADYTFRYGDDSYLMKRMPIVYYLGPDVQAALGATTNSLTNWHSTRLYTATNIYADYTHSFANAHNIKLMAGYNYETQSYDALNVSRNGTIIPSAENINLSLGEDITTSGSANRWRIAGLFYRVNYDFKNRYLLELDGRYDGSSKFPDNQQWAFFPSVSAGWRISEEPFWNIDPKYVSNVKVRASYGSLGNGNVSPYSYLELLSPSTSSKVLNGIQNKYVSNPAVKPEGLTWETATTVDGGLDFQLLNGRFNFSGDYYVRKTTDMYTVGMTLPEVFGATSPKGNYADMTTRGWEISVEWKDQFELGGSPFRYGIKASMHDYTSVIDKYNNQTGLLSDYYAGMTIGELWGFKSDGLFQSEAELEGYVNTLVTASADGKWRVGDVRYVDLNGNGRIDYGKNTVDDHGDKIIIGNTAPHYQYSFTLSGDWRGIFVNAFFQGVGKQDWYPGQEAVFWGQYNRPYNNIPKWHLGNYWTPDNPDAYLPRYCTYNGTVGRSNYPNSRYVQNIAYIRLKSMQVGYNLPSRIVSKMGLSDLKLYLSGENLWSWSPLYKITKRHQDVYTASRGTDADLSSSNYGDGNSYPLLRTVTFGVSLTF